MARSLLYAMWLLSVASMARAQTSYPMLMSLKPAAAQVGQASEHELEARYSMFGAYRVFVTGEGVTGEVVTPMELKDGKEPDLTKIKLRFTVAADAQPGVRDFRVVGPTGPSTLGQLFVTRDPVVSEQDKNDAPDQAQDIALPATVCGAVEKAEDVDYFKFKLEQPATLNFHCLAMRLEDKLHDVQQHVDPIITVKNAATGSTVAAADNAYAADPFLSHALPAGEHLLEVRDVRYQGNKYWEYAIEISDRPFVSHVHPLAVAPGGSAQLKLVGFHLPETSLVSFTAPTDRHGGLEVRLPMGEALTNPVPVVVSDLPVTVEAEGDNNKPETAQPITLPAGISGRIEAEADVDCFAFEAKKGDRISVEVVARRYWSGLDSIVRVLNASGAALTENDDLREWGKLVKQDSAIDFWAVPEDGKYVIEVRDVHLRGDDSFVYFLRVEPSRPTFELFLDSDKTWLTPGGCAAVFARCVRKNGFDGEIQLQIEGLPPGVTATCGKILPGKGQDGCIILDAAPDAALAAANITVYGTGTVPAPAGVPTAAGSAPPEAGAATGDSANAATVPLRMAAQNFQETYMPGGGRAHWPVPMHTVAVGKPGDIRTVKLSTYDVALKPGESVKIDVEIERGAYDKNVTLDLLFQHLSSVFANTLPEGVTIDAKNSKTLLTGNESKGHFTLTVAGNAPPVEKQQCCVMANVSINFVMKSTWSSRPLMVMVVKP